MERRTDGAARLVDISVTGDERQGPEKDQLANTRHCFRSILLLCQRFRPQDARDGNSAQTRLMGATALRFRIVYCPVSLTHDH